MYNIKFLLGPLADHAEKARNGRNTGKNKQRNRELAGRKRERIMKKRGIGIGNGKGRRSCVDI